MKTKLRKRRPSALNEKLATKIMDEMRKGKEVSDVVKSCGISRGTFYKWVKLGETQPGTLFEHLKDEYDRFRESQAR